LEDTQTNSSVLKRHYPSWTFDATNLHSMPYSDHAYYDANRASDITSGAYVFLGPNLVSGWSKKQSLVALSNAETEYKSLALETAEIIRVQLFTKRTASCSIHSNTLV